MASLSPASKMLQTPSSQHRERLECVSVLEWLLCVCMCVLILNELFAVLCREEGVGKQPSLTWMVENPLSCLILMISVEKVIRVTES